MSGITSNLAMAILPLSATSQQLPCSRRPSSQYRQQGLQIASKVLGTEEARAPALLLTPPSETIRVRNRDQRMQAANEQESDSESRFVFPRPPNSFVNGRVLSIELCRRDK